MKTKAERKARRQKAIKKVKKAFKKDAKNPVGTAVRVANAVKPIVRALKK